ncbi:50S ribosomal protein L9 [Leucobacter luti]|uniref:Large ribosomal subunit protein bL9 n=1 Tax=Leucobacter luti TaxID=340320 RepID=A0A4R6S1X6_9MICO|nr:50S ribosomal protein L9 [Leucobacter luti]MCW2289318.1 large subunit ribosomal protein L9 [Leucobacter luti]QYM74881.1 50S ribosomal protein L9 [Leucobacter luti]TCK39878.1 LSU ribosomal protein L9P [Leucobacter luti]TDP93263.1 LSU ribosomal protein L9P [Leucobacter luti]
MAKVILTNEVQGLGSAGDVVDVKTGYARNYLVPQGYGVHWTRGGEAQVAQIRAARDARALASVEDAQALKAKLQEGKIRLQAKTGTGGRLFGSVKPAAVAAAVSQAGIGEIDKRKITVPSIKSTGEYKAIVHLHDGVDATVTIQVISQR